MEKAIQDMKRRKVIGGDIPVEVLKGLKEEGPKTLTKIINNIYVIGEWSQEILDVTLVALKKKQQAKKCEDYRTISLVSRRENLAARTLNKKLKQEIEEKLVVDRIGFRKEKEPEMPFRNE